MQIRCGSCSYASKHHPHHLGAFHSFLWQVELAAFCKCMGPSLPPHSTPAGHPPAGAWDHSPHSTPAGHLLLLPWHCILGRCLCSLSPMPLTLVEAPGFHVLCLGPKLDLPTAPTSLSLICLTEKQQAGKSLPPALRVAWSTWPASYATLGWVW